MLARPVPPPPDPARQTLRLHHLSPNNQALLTGPA